MVKFTVALALATTSAYAVKFGAGFGIGGPGLNDKFIGGGGFGGSLASKMGSFGGAKMGGFGNGSSVVGGGLASKLNNVTLDAKVS